MIKTNKTLTYIRTPMNQSNICNQHTLTCIYQKAVQIGFTNQFITHHTTRYSINYTEKIQLKPHQLPLENLATKPS